MKPFPWIGDGAAAAGAAVATTGDAELDSICSRALAALSGAKPDEQVYVGGASAMASAFDAVDTVRSVLRTLEQQYVIVSLVRSIIERGLSVAIGVEHGIEPLAACSVVVKPVVVDGEQAVFLEGLEFLQLRHEVLAEADREALFHAQGIAVLAIGDEAILDCFTSFAMTGTDGFILRQRALPPGPRRSAHR